MADQHIEIDYGRCPNQAMVGGLQRFLEAGVPPGHFLTALLANDLMETFARADDTNVRLIREWCIFLYNWWPHDAKGSLERVRDICKAGGYLGWWQQKRKLEAESDGVL